MRNKNPNFLTLPNSGAGTVEIDCNTGTAFLLPLTGNCTIQLSNIVPGETVELLLLQDGVGGRTVTFTGYTITGFAQPAPGALTTTVLTLLGTGTTTAVVKSNNTTNAGGSNLATVGNFLQLKNDATAQPSGVKIDCQTGDVVEIAAGANTMIRVTEALASIGEDSGISVFIGRGGGSIVIGDNGSDIVVGSNTTDPIGFYGAVPVNKQAGVAVTAAAIHAALVNLGLIAA